VRTSTGYLEPRLLESRIQVSPKVQVWRSCTPPYIIQVIVWKTHTPLQILFNHKIWDITYSIDMKYITCSDTCEVSALFCIFWMIASKRHKIVQTHCYSKNVFSIPIWAPAIISGRMCSDRDRSYIWWSVREYSRFKYFVKYFWHFFQLTIVYMLINKDIIKYIKIIEIDILVNYLTYK